MKKLILATAAALSSASVFSTVIDFDIGPLGLNAANERPVGSSTGTGTGSEIGGAFTLSYDDVSNQLTVNLQYSNLSGSFSGAHIHGPVLTTPATEGSAGILFDLFTYVNQTSGNSGFIQGVVGDNNPGGETISESQEADLLAGRWYVNIHSSAFPSGEIRGQLTPVPEPQTYAMIGGLALLGFAGYRRYKIKTALSAA